MALTFVSYSLARGSEGVSSGWKAIPDHCPSLLWTWSPHWLFLPSGGSPTALSPLEPSRLSMEGLFSHGLHEARICPRHPHFRDGSLHLYIMLLAPSLGLSWAADLLEAQGKGF